ncbi:GDP-mannose 4,6-dehydratase [Hyphobacterium sp.]|uniref:GDP-mannose 4,6-dehydratase n=1 Tax=Hyphobacterium sp. TaxID=2004662 RepID=UPI00374A2264
MTRVLICGIGGQDASFLAQHLLNKRCEVWGTSRDAESGRLSNLDRLGIANHVKVISMEPSDFRSVFTAVDRAQPDAMHYL